MGIHSYKPLIMLAVSAAAAIAVTPSFAASPTIVLSIPVAGVVSNDVEDALANVYSSIALTPFYQVTGISWSVQLNAAAPSWLSEMTVVFGSTSAPKSLYVSPGISDQVSGTQTYFSGMLDLVALNADFALNADGQLKWQFFDSVNDLAGVDGTWLNGSLNVLLVPEPGTYGLMAFGLLAVAAAARNRKAA